MKKALVAIVVLIAVSGIGFWGMKLTVQNPEQQASPASLEGQEFVSVVLNNFLATRDQQYLIENSTSGFIPDNTDSKLKEIAFAFRSLGQFREVLSITSDTDKTYASTAPAPSSEYWVVETDFERGGAEIYVELVMENGSWKINNLNFFSTLLLVFEADQYWHGARNYV